MERRRPTWIGPVLCCIALAIPAAMAQTDAPDVARPWMGVFLGDETDGGVRLVAVVPGGPAQRAGVRRGDVLIQARDLRVLRLADLKRALAPLGPGHSVELKLVRAGEVVPVVVELAPYPGTPRPDPLLALPAPPLPPAPPAELNGCREYGLTVTEITPDLRVHYGATSNSGLLVVAIDPRRDAADDGFRVGDLLVSVGDEQVYRAADVERWLADRAGDNLTASVIRDREARVLSVRRAPSGTDVRARSERPIAPGDYETAVRNELDRLNRRIEELKRELDALHAEP